MKELCAGLMTVISREHLLQKNVTSEYYLETCKHVKFFLGIYDI